MKLVLSIKQVGTGSNQDGLISDVLTNVSSDQLLLGQLYVSNNSGRMAMYEPYKSDDISCNNTFGVKMCI